jgi:FkbM family methyltransferase
MLVYGEGFLLDTDRLVKTTTNPLFIFKNVKHVVAPILANGVYEKSLIDWCKQFGSSQGSFVDIGAHSGTYSITLAPYFCKVYAFEPQRDTYYQLCGGIALNNLENVYAERCALGNVALGGAGTGPGSLIGDARTLSIISEDGGGSTLNRVPAGAALKTETVPYKNLDDFQITLPIGLIKIDVEGHELEVLRGATNTLKCANFPRILVEVWDASMSPNRQEVFDHLRDLGYTVRRVSGYSYMYLASMD